jgi:hypothetical protein
MLTDYGKRSIFSTISHMDLMMSRAGKFVVVASVIWLVANEAIAAHRTSISVLLGVFSSLCFLGVIVFSLVLSFTDWQQRRWRALLPLAACVVAIAIFLPLGRLITDAVFDWSLPSYEAIVQQVESGSIPTSVEFSEMPQAERQARLAYGVFAQKDTNGVVRVMFFTESGFPALHSGYLYTSSGEPGSGVESRWPTVHKVRNKWFYISN